MAGLNFLCEGPSTVFAVFARPLSHRLTSAFRNGFPTCGQVRSNRTPFSSCHPSRPNLCGKRLYIKRLMRGRMCASEAQKFAAMQVRYFLRALGFQVATSLTSVLRKVHTDTPERERMPASRRASLRCPGRESPFGGSRVRPPGPPFPVQASNRGPLPPPPGHGWSTACPGPRRELRGWTPRRRDAAPSSCWRTSRREAAKRLDATGHRK